jgi:hypothetical protein
MTDDTTLPTPTGPDRLPTPLERLAEIPEEEIWLRKQKSKRTRRAYWTRDRFRRLYELHTSRGVSRHFW